MNDDCQSPLDVARVKGYGNVVRAIDVVLKFHNILLYYSDSSELDSNISTILVIINIDLPCVFLAARVYWAKLS